MHLSRASSSCYLGVRRRDFYHLGVTKVFGIAHSCTTRKVLMKETAHLLLQRTTILNIPLVCCTWHAAHVPTWMVVQAFLLSVWAWCGEGRGIGLIPALASFQVVPRARKRKSSKADIHGLQNLCFRLEWIEKLAPKKKIFVSPYCYFGCSTNVAVSARARFVVSRCTCGNGWPSKAIHLKCQRNMRPP